ncbi:MAG: ImmA/IrrE family metallo-endopeptidase [Lachnospiraceae bacterium]|nr:ImmA/IrrE family metallo-endopeptidase [Lachnospiraceae bacterium]
MSQSQQIKEITDKLQEGIENLFESDNYKNYLKTMSKFTSYSLNNTILIAMQKPDATVVAGYSTWKQLNRQVVKGAKSIKIIAPCPYRKKVETEVTGADGNIILGRDGKPVTEQSEKTLMGFKVASVFDLSQTEGEPLPELAHKLDGTVEGYADFIEALKQTSPVPIEFKTIEGSANGYYHLVDKNIVVDDGMSQMMNIKTTIHEISHALLHDRDSGLEKDALPDKLTKEVEAESVAFTVCQYYGLDTSDYSFGYIAGWSSGRDLKELKASLETIRQTAQRIISGIDLKLDAIRQSKQMDIDSPKTIVLSADIESVRSRKIRH